eukprot:GHVN01043254.1.p2 GENE.GHVN01043254.1~~GHVN01043254.1.p2  ORF type:complete len:132 (-),score=0.48 GHVN01043254.1:763-1158(-)
MKVLAPAPAAVGAHTSTMRAVILIATVVLVGLTLSQRLPYFGGATPTTTIDAGALRGLTTLSTSSAVVSLGIPALVVGKTRAHACTEKDQVPPKEQLQMLSQQDEDKVLMTWFGGLCGGTYIEMGALDGKR